MAQKKHIMLVITVDPEQQYKIKDELVKAVRNIADISLDDWYIETGGDDPWDEAFDSVLKLSEKLRES